jgi:hypothetical protein
VPSQFRRVIVSTALAFRAFFALSHYFRLLLESGVNFSVSLKFGRKRHLSSRRLQQSIDFHKRSLRRLSPPAVLAYEFGLKVIT